MVNSKSTTNISNSDAKKSFSEIVRLNNNDNIPLRKGNNDSDSNKYIAVIRNVTTLKCKNYFYVRNELCKKLGLLKINYTKLTTNNNLLISCFDIETYNKITNSETLIFGSIHFPLTLKAFQLVTKSYKLHVKNVDKNIEIAAIKDVILKLSTNEILDDDSVSVKRMKKDNNPLNSIIVILRSQQLYDSLLLNGFVHEQMFYMPTMFVEKVHVKFCNKCLKIGHTTNKCLSTKSLCVNCSSQEHVLTDCKSDAYCANCKLSGHASNDKSCPLYKTHVKQALEFIKHV